MQITIQFHDDEEAQEILGVRDIHLRKMRSGFSIEASARGRVLDLQGADEAVSAAQLAVERMLSAHRESGSTSPADVLDDALVNFQQAEEAQMVISGSEMGQNFSGTDQPVDHVDLRKIARSEGQAQYLKAMAENDIVMALGPAGTGKTYLAVRTAVEALKSGQVRKLILSRPAVEAGEKLGFLPGDFQQKVNPYLRPLYDALHDMLDYDQVRRYSDREIIEIVPLAYMRGRTLNQAFIILDEAQNTTPAQMKMFLTRMGARSKIVVTGDPTQLDLPKGQPSGLLHARRVLGSVEGLAWVELGTSDIVRNRLVTGIVDAYERHEGSSS